MRYLRSITIAFAALLGLSASAAAADLTGMVAFSGKAAADVVISIEGLRQDVPPEAAVYVIDHRNLNFVPHVLVVRTGSAVRFENSDGMPCRIYSISPMGNFVFRRQDGKPVTITFDREGVIEVRCAEHGRIYAYVIVRENPFFALTDSKGQYQISNVPPGRYTLQVWYEGQVIRSQTFEVGIAKQKIDFKLSRPQRKERKEREADLSSLVLSALTLPGGLSTENPKLWRSQK